MTRETDTDRETMADISHTNPHTGETAGRLFTRGPVVATDGGERSPSESRSDGDRSKATDAGSDEQRERTMASVDHTPPHDAETANRVFERGKRPVGADE
ncbi:hypothetical protein [Natrialba swarupiae]|uniref:Uncharacterized protein n=1 Tax=Natrialba swarupiae TaxID=2448032 RepID=A0A5D5AKX3_9EURY|nr:hypothetical protein [Natrialba swarupiae]TYT60392.1 hypothetical protein FYC77_19160 [Natrialba swarupiae]